MNDVRPKTYTFRPCSRSSDCPGTAMAHIGPQDQEGSLIAYARHVPESLVCGTGVDRQEEIRLSLQQRSPPIRLGSLNARLASETQNRRKKESIGAPGSQQSP